MDIKDNYKNTQWGTKQADRFPKALADGYIQIDERGFEDFLKQVEKFSHQLYFYDDAGIKSSWCGFFGTNGSELQRQMEEGTVEPHLALLLAFFKLYAKEQEQLNSLLKRYHDFYFKDVLGFAPRKGTIGTVPVFCQLAKTAKKVFVGQGTLFDAGKNKESQPIYYSAMEDVTLSNAEMVLCKRYGKDGKIYDINLNDNGVCLSATPDRYEVYVILRGLDVLDGTVTLKVSKKLKDFVKVDYTSNDGWKLIEQKNFPLSVNLDAFPFAHYNKKIHKGSFQTDGPMLRITTDKVANVASIATAVSSLTIEVEHGKNVLINNSYGMVDNRNGAFPFGPVCRVGDAFSISLPFTPSKVKAIQLNMASGNESVAIGYKKRINTYPCQVELTIDTYNQNSYATEFAKYIAKKINQEPIMKSPLSLTKPLSVDYSFEFGGGQCHFECPGFDEQQVHNIQLLFSLNDQIDSSLYFQVANADSADTINLYFKINVAKVVKPSKIYWEYFDGNEWKEFKGHEIVKNTTNEFTSSGAVVLKTPAVSLLWIRVLFVGTYDFYAIEDVRTNVIELQYDDSSIGAPCVGEGLPQGTISKLLTSQPGIKKVLQPYDGSAGKKNESDFQFLCRVSEKLRHKGRAWTTWDYERLVLEKFPMVSSVQCYPTRNKDCKIEAGSVLLVVVPLTHGFVGQNPLKPKVVDSDLKDIKAYLENHCSGQVSVDVMTPEFEPVQVDCCVTLREGYTDKSHYRSLLSSRLTTLLSPWIDGESDIEPQRCLNESDIVSFIAQQPYVDKVWDIQITVNGVNAPRGYDLLPSRIGYVLTSSDNHIIRYFDD